MNLFLWILQCVLALMLVISGVSAFVAVRRGMVRSPVLTLLVAVVGLVSAVGLIVPWATGDFRVFTPVAAVVVVVGIIGDAATNYGTMPRGELVYNVLLVAAGVTIAVGRFADL